MRTPRIVVLSWWWRRARGWGGGARFGSSLDGGGAYVSSGSSDRPHAASANRRLNSVALLAYSYMILLKLCVPTPSPRTAAAAPTEAAHPRAEGAAHPLARSWAAGARTRPHALVADRTAGDGVSEQHNEGRSG
jgi:hypothetical protein